MNARRFPGPRVIAAALVLCALAFGFADAVKAAASNGHILFGSRTGLKVVKPDGSGGKLLPLHPFHGVALSPDGRRSAFDYSLGRTKGSVLVVATRAGKHRHPVATLRFEASTDFNPVFSNDSKRLAYTTELGVAVVSASGGASTLLAPDVGSLDPAWAPDNEHVLVAGGRMDVQNQVDANGVEALPGRCGKPRALYLLGLDGTTQTLFSSDSFQPSGAAWSPDGKQIAFVNCNPSARAVVGISGPYPGTLWLMNPDGTNLHSLGVTGYSPRWSPDSKRLAYVSQTGIRIIAASGGKTKLLVKLADLANAVLGWIA